MIASEGQFSFIYATEDNFEPSWCMETAEWLDAYCCSTVNYRACLMHAAQQWACMRPEHHDWARLMHATETVHGKPAWCMQHGSPIAAWERGENTWYSYCMVCSGAEGNRIATTRRRGHLASRPHNLRTSTVCYLTFFGVLLARAAVKKGRKVLQIA